MAMKFCHSRNRNRDDKSWMRFQMKHDQFMKGIIWCGLLGKEGNRLQEQEGPIQSYFHCFYGTLINWLATSPLKAVYGSVFQWWYLQMLLLHSKWSGCMASAGLWSGHSKTNCFLELHWCISCCWNSKVLSLANILTNRTLNSMGTGLPPRTGLSKVQYICNFATIQKWQCFIICMTSF